MYAEEKECDQNRSASLTRFDIPDSVATVFDVALRAGVLDAKELFALGAHLGRLTAETCLTPEDCFHGIVAEITEIAFANRHSPEGRETHALICVAADAFYKAANKEYR